MTLPFFLKAVQRKKCKKIILNVTNLFIKIQLNTLINAISCILINCKINTRTTRNIDVITQFSLTSDLRLKQF
jgi:hypothetical protein